MECANCLTHRTVMIVIMIMIISVIVVMIMIIMMSTIIIIIAIMIMLVIAMFTVIIIVFPVVIIVMIMISSASINAFIDHFLSFQYTSFTLHRQQSRLQLIDLNIFTGNRICTLLSTSTFYHKSFSTTLSSTFSPLLHIKYISTFLFSSNFSLNKY